MTLYLIRHTRVQITPGICYGQSDIPLADTFESEAEEILRKLPQKGFPVYSSPLSRCTELAHKISSTFHIDPRLMELDFGKWEMKAWEKIDRIKSDFWMEDFVTRTCPDGESYQQMASRVACAAEQIARECPEAAVIVTHSGVIRLFWVWAHERPLSDAFEFQIGYGDIYRVKCQGSQFLEFQSLTGF